jgi:uncharacterized protein (TIGR03435 family)
MLQDLIRQRFQMESHLEDRTSSGYDLVVAPGGPKLKAPANPNAPDPTAGPRGGADKDGFPILPAGRGSGVIMGNGTRAKFQNYTVSEFARGSLRDLVFQSIGSQPGPIRDRTGLAGKYDFTLAFDPRRHVAPVSGRATAGASGEAAASDATAPSGLPDLFGALEKQLGLKLAPVKDIPVKALVIDKVEKTPLED